jgi:hypothetical protein
VGIPKETKKDVKRNKYGGNIEIKRGGMDLPV